MKTGLCFDEVFPTIPAEGWLAEDEARLLWEIASVCEGPILEVGCYCGRSTILLAHLGRPVYAVDPFAGFSRDDPTGEGIKTRFLENLAYYAIHNVLLFQQRIEDWEPCPLGFAYLDGDHTYAGTVAQIRKALVCKPQYIALHDIGEQGEAVDVTRAAFNNLGAWTLRANRLAVWRIVS